MSVERRLNVARFTRRSAPVASRFATCSRIGPMDAAGTSKLPSHRGGAPGFAVSFTGGWSA